MLRRGEQWLDLHVVLKNLRILNFNYYYGNKRSVRKEYNIFVTKPFRTHTNVIQIGSVGKTLRCGLAGAVDCSSLRIRSPQSIICFNATVFAVAAVGNRWRRLRAPSLQYYYYDRTHDKLCYKIYNGTTRHTWVRKYA